MVLIANSRIFGNVILKLIPEFINRYEYEKNFYLVYKNTYLCKLLDFDDDCCALLLERVKPAKYAAFEDNLLLSDFWKIVFDSVVPYNSSYVAVDYYSELKKRVCTCSDLPFMQKETEAALNNALLIYDDVFKYEKNYYIHGDLHQFNIIKNTSRYVAIDPIGFKAPKEFETARFIRNDILKNTGFEMTERFGLLVDYFSKWCNKDLIIRAEYVDLAYTLYNSTFENDSPSQSEKMLKLLNIVYKYVFA